MREFKGEWKDIFKLFPVFFDPRKLIYSLTGLLTTVVCIGLITFFWATTFGGNNLVLLYKSTTAAGTVVYDLPQTFTIDSLVGWYLRYLSFILNYTPVYSWIGYIAIAAVVFFLIWSYFGGAVCRSAAYEIAKDGERLESSKISSFVAKRYWGFFMPPVLCILGFTFFYLCNFIGGFFMKLVDLLAVALNIGHLGAIIGALLLFLCLLAGFIMALITVGSLFGFKLFAPAIAVEGTEAFDAVSRGFAYVFSKPFHYIWYQLTAGVFGFVCFAFIFVITILVGHFGLTSAANGFSFAWKDKGNFHEVRNYAWSHVLSPKYQQQAANLHWDLRSLARNPKPYTRLMALSTSIVGPKFNRTPPTSRSMKLSAYIAHVWLFLLIYIAYASAISYYFTAQTMIYLLLRKKVDDIDISEIYPEEEEEQFITPEQPAAKPQEQPTTKQA